MNQRWDTIRRTPAFAFAAAFVIWILVSHFINHETWGRSTVFAILFACLMTATFEVLKRRRQR